MPFPSQRPPLRVRPLTRWRQQHTVVARGAASREGDAATVAGALAEQPPVGHTAAASPLAGAHWGAERAVVQAGATRETPIKGRSARLAAMIRKLRWTAWHPHEKFWNWSLVHALNKVMLGGRVARLTIRAVIAVDTGILMSGAILRRLRQPRLPRLPRSRTPLLYVDCGTHKEELEARWMHRWFGNRFDLRTLAFEASSNHFRDARAALADVPTVELLQLALVGPGARDSVRRFESSGDGRGDSLFSSVGDKYEGVPARRLTAVLAELGVSLDRQPVILRMNIEGAEQYVINDLDDAGALGLVDGYYGMWDDLSKIDPEADDEFRRVLRRRRISSFTFNDRDLWWSLRRFAIRFDIETSIRAALARKAFS